MKSVGILITKEEEVIVARRFTDNEKWKDEWFGSLSNDMRIVWLYLIDSCSIAGIWKKDFRGLNFNCNTSLTEDEFIKVFGSRVIDNGNFFFIPKFLRYQCPKGLNSNKPAILSIVKEIQLNNLTTIVNQLLGNDFLIIKDKGKGKDKGDGKYKGKEKDRYVTIDDEIVYDVVKILEHKQASLNGRQAEHQTRGWRDVAKEWFETVLLHHFNDEAHLFNTFSKYLITYGKPPTGQRNGTHVQKLKLEDLNS